MDGERGRSRRTGKLPHEGAAGFRSLVETVPAVVYVDDVDSAATPLYVSPQIRKLIGYAPEDFIGRPDFWWSIIHPDDVGRVRSYDDIHDQESPWSLRYRMIAADGNVVWVQDEALLIRSERGEKLCWQGMMLDVSSHVEAEDALRRRDAIAEAAVFASRQFLHAEAWEDAVEEVLRHLGEAVEASRAYLWQNGVGENGELTMSAAFEWCAPGVSPTIDDPENFAWPYSDGYQDWAVKLARGEIVHGPRESFSKQVQEDMESEGILSMLGAPVFVGEEWWGFIGFDDCETPRVWSQNETEALHLASETIGAAINRLRAEQKLREAESRFRTLVEQIPAVTYLEPVHVEAESATMYMSPQMKTMLGWSEWGNDVAGWRAHVHPADRDRVLKETSRARDAGELLSLEYRMMSRDGRVVWIDERAAVLRDENGRPRLIQGVMYDVTERKLAEQELARSFKREREAAEHLRALDTMKSTLLHAVSHDLKAPISGVLAAALLLDRENEDMSGEDRRTVLSSLVSSARKMDRLVSDLLDLDRLDRGIVEPDRESTDVGELIRKLVAELEETADRPINIEVDPVVISVEPATGRVADRLVFALDRKQVERMIENLLRNAVAHTPPGTPIWVRAYKEDGGLVVSVEDGGPGVPEDMREAIFEPFRRGAAAGAEQGGLGIGLSLVARFAELHGGRAWVGEREGGGAAFRFYLPDGVEAPEDGADPVEERRKAD
jgi:PAS domain S-box-containing protein